jgi:acyl-CoA reductase-like NAD-dependent aldehyde dehydrogenase
VALDERRIEEIVARVVERLAGAGALRAPSSGPPIASGGGAVDPDIPRGTNGVYPDPDSAVNAALRGFEANEKAPLALRQRMVQAMRDVTRKHVQELSRLVVAECGIGRVADKIVKNGLVIDKTPGPEILQPVAFTGDHGLMLTERAPYGVLLAITPCTNATETILCNAIGMVAGGNAVVFNVHPSVARSSNWHVHLLNEAIVSVGGPRDTIVSIEQPTIESANALMTHPRIRMSVVTGGPGVVKAALDSGKKVIAAGPGNPPAIVDETADLDVAARNIVIGASIDNNVVCIAEKEVIAVQSIADGLTERLTRSGALLLDDRQVRELEKVILDGDHVNRKWVGKDAGVIAEQIGLRGHGQDLRLLLCRVDEQHPFVQHELLMPVLPMVTVRDTTEAIAAALRVEHGFHHTATMHSTNIDNMAAMARICNCSIFVKNAPCLAGLGYEGEGYTSFTIASPTGEGLTTAVHFTRERRCTLKDSFRFV